LALLDVRVHFGASRPQLRVPVEQTDEQRDHPEGGTEKATRQACPTTRLVNAMGEVPAR
jgi:hypothetical protein